MANKRYDQFTEGTPDSESITLFANPATGELMKTLFPQGFPVKMAIVLLTQSGTDDPTVEPVYSNFNNPITAIRTDFGTYQILSSGEFTTGATAVLFNLNTNQQSYSSIVQKLDADTITLQTFIELVPSDDVLFSSSLFIITPL